MGYIHCILLVAVIGNVLSVKVTEPPNIAEPVQPETNNKTELIPKGPGENITLKTVPGSFVGHQIVPDIIPVSPKNLANVTFPNGKIVSLGNKLTPTQVQLMPTVSWDADRTQYYTLIAIDPDLPSRKSPVYRSTLHWLVTNIPGDDISGGNTTAEYISSGPPPKSGLHRFIFLVYEQPGIISFDEIKLNNTSSYGRHGFSPVNFATKYNLSEPVAGNFFQTSYDSYVPVLYKILGYSHATTIAPGYLVMAALAVVLFWISN